MSALHRFMLAVSVVALILSTTLPAMASNLAKASTVSSSFDAPTGASNGEFFPGLAGAKALAGISASSAVLNGPQFVRCIVNTYRLMPQAKKLSPIQYQEFERTLGTALQATSVVKLGPYLTAIRTGARIAKFIGYDFVFYFGLVQSCWFVLWR